MMGIHRFFVKVYGGKIVNNARLYSCWCRFELSDSHYLDIINSKCFMYLLTQSAVEI